MLHVTTERTNALRNRIASLADLIDLDLIGPAGLPGTLRLALPTTMLAPGLAVDAAFGEALCFIDDDDLHPVAAKKPAKDEDAEEDEDDDLEDDDEDAVDDDEDDDLDDDEDEDEDEDDEDEDDEDEDEFEDAEEDEDYDEDEEEFEDEDE